jgi:PAS domain S-box-containing protein
MERILSQEDFIVSKTDLSGKITYVNKIFMDLAEYSEAELLGKPHSIVRHEDMPRAVFQMLWDHVKQKKEIFAYVVNKTKQGNYYWVYANVTPSMDERGNVIGYYSVRRKPNAKALEIIRPLYTQMINAERNGGIDAGKRVLENALAEQGATYDEFIIHIQE